MTDGNRRRGRFIQPIGFDASNQNCSRSRGIFAYCAGEVTPDLDAEDGGRVGEGRSFCRILPAQHRATVYVEDFPGDERGVFGA